MKQIKIVSLIFFICFFTPVLVIATELPYLFQQLEKPAYLKAFELLFKDETNIELWLSHYIKDRNGVDIPGKELEVQGKVYELYEVCQPHACPGNFIYFFF